MILFYNQYMIIRLATIDDTEELLDIYRPYVLDTAITFEYDVPTYEEFKSRIIHTLEDFPYYVAIIDDKIVGYAYASHFHPRIAYQYLAEISIYIDQNYHHQGIGKKLYNLLEETLKKQNIHTLCACIATADTEDEYLNNNSMHFHEHLGFKLVGSHHHAGYKFNNWYNMIWMEKDIIPKNDHPSPFIPYRDL